MGWTFADSGTGRTYICTCNAISMQKSSCGCGQERKEWILCISWFLSSLIYAATRDAVGLLSHCIHNSMSPCKEELLFCRKTCFASATFKLVIIRFISLNRLCLLHMLWPLSRLLTFPFCAHMWEYLFLWWYQFFLQLKFHPKFHAT